MGLIQYLDQKRKLDVILTLTVVCLSIVVDGIVVWKALAFAGEERQKIYVLNGGVPMMADRTDQSMTMGIEAKAHINLFHELFFTLAPDETYINYNLERAMYLIDESGLVQRNTLQEKGFYNNIVSASAMCGILCDSINFNENTKEFTYYGRQRIERKTTVLYRELITKGKIKQTIRTEKNPHGMLIIDYKTILNKDLQTIEKSKF
jgi:conjugative transposon TraK protein